MKVSVRIEGGAELAKVLNDLPKRVSKRVLRNALEAAGEPIRQGMARLAPREPGAPDLADHMVISGTRVEGLQDNDQTAAVAIGPEREFFYGFFQEWGTAFHGAQPFARPAFDSGVDRALKEITSALWTELAAVGIARLLTKASPVQSDGPLL